jgi:hypothetical protein
MAQPKIRVRSKLTGDIALVAPSALKHFPDFERVDPVPNPAPVAAAPAAEANDAPKTTRRAAAKNEEE